jgi:hypothetical protein
MSYIKSSSSITIDNKNYLQIFLEKEYYYEVNDNNEDKKIVEFLIEEPDRKDINNLKSIASILNSYLKRNEDAFTKAFSELSQDEQERLIKLYKEAPSNNKENEIVLTPEEKANQIKEEIKKLFVSNNENKNYYENLDVIKLFIEKKLYRQFAETAQKLSSKTLIDNNKNLSISDQVLLEEDIAIEFISFFLKHIPFRALNELQKDKK